MAFALAGAAAAEERPEEADAGAAPVRLGIGEAELRERFGAALVGVPVERVRSVQEQILADGATGGRAAADAPEPADPFADQLRLVREIGGDPVRREEYDLFRGRVYRLRWLLAERFERPLMQPLVAHLRERLGEPAYDQTLEAKLGSGRAELRRTGWRRGGLALEVRQLHPFTGGPLYLSLSDVAAARAIVDARGVVLPQPESTGDWWRRPQRKPELLTSAEESRLLSSIDALLAGIDFPPAAPARPSPAEAQRRG